MTEVAHALGDLLPEVTFVGGCTTVLLVDRAAYSGVRQTKDVDVIIDVTSYLDYQHFSARLRDSGFVEDVEGPNCRWLWRTEFSEIQLDVMPADEAALGFSNRWYQDAIAHSESHSLGQELNIAVVGSVYFLATKLEAFKGRGNGDYFSHDIEDIVFVLENRAGIIQEILDAPLELKEYLAVEFEAINNEDFLNVLPGILEKAQFPNCMHGLLIAAARQARGDALPTMPMRWNHLR